ncbi:MAG: glycine--tRNA ligase [Candidatus Pacearchaeota archaeon]|nr:glycine--tRNA ligase [Candidatus Pacearchaeota archaeon]
MVYIVKQKINGKDYFYLRKSVREGKKVTSKHVAYLGSNREEAEKKYAEYKSEEILKNSQQSLSSKEIKPRETEEKNRTEKKETPMEKENSITKELENKLVQKKISIDELAKFCKEKGFIFRSSDIYGGYAGFWDFGPLGVELFSNIKKDWWSFFVQKRDNIVGMEASIISHPRTWKASGHLENFNDVAVICKKCKIPTKIDKNEIGKVNCKCGGEFEIKGEFSLMFKTKVGALDTSEAYLRGETAQGMFMDFKLISQTSRMQLPFGIAQIGRCFRNEIAPRDFLFRSREFNIGEFEFFINPEEKKCELLTKEQTEVRLSLLDSETQTEGKETLKETTIGKMLEEKRMEEWHAYWLAEQIKWYNSLNLFEIKIREHKKDELSHYSSATFDIDYEYPFGSVELGGNANRGQYDLTQHSEESGESMEVFDEKYKNKIIPKVIEPTFGMERVFLALLTKAYSDDGRGNITLNLPPQIAPIKAAVFPVIKNNEELVKLSKEICEDLKKEFNIMYDSGGSIGRRYARQDEIGTVACITLDEQSLKDKTITIRDRNTTEQVRVKISELKEVMRKVINEEYDILEFGKRVNTRVK